MWYDGDEEIGRQGARRAHVWVTGRVQGVYFRSYTQRKAQTLNLRGWVRNLPDGRVEAVFEGAPEAVGQAVRWCYSGPPNAYVQTVDVQEEPPTGSERGFQIRG